MHIKYTVIALDLDEKSATTVGSFEEFGFAARFANALNWSDVDNTTENECCVLLLHHEDMSVQIISQFSRVV